MKKLPTQKEINRKMSSLNFSDKVLDKEKFGTPQIYKNLAITIKQSTIINIVENLMKEVKKNE